MFIQEGNHKIWISFNEGLRIRISGDDQIYLVQVFEYMPGSELPNLIYGLNLLNNDESFEGRMWYGKYKVDISRWDEELGIILLHSHTYDDRGKDVFFRIDNSNLRATRSWVDEVKNYVQMTGCIPHILTSFNEELSIETPKEGVEYYNSYNIGRYYQETNGDIPQAHGEIRYSLFRKYWSHHNPRNWEKLQHNQIARDILGLTEWEDGILFTTDNLWDKNPRYIT